MNDDLRSETDTNSSRRAVLTAAAWSAPVVAAAIAVPADAASRCGTQNLSLNWANTTASGPTPVEDTNTTVTRQFVFAQTAQTSPALPNMNVSVTHSFAGNARSANVTTSGTVSVLAQNATRTGTNGNGNGIGPVGGTGQPGYTIAQRITTTATRGVGAVTANDYQDVLINFNEDVSNVRFAISDIDRTWNSTTRDFVDGVTVIATNAAGANVPVVRNASQPNTTIVGSGTATDPFYRNVEGNVSEATNVGNLALIAGGPTPRQALRTIRIRYRNRGYLEAGSTASNVDNNQTIFLTGLILDRGTRIC